jgi:menaquinone-9 beta-reductase
VNATLDITEASKRVWDVVVIGAGPAGSVAARELARRGAAVLLIDKGSFPRFKVCGCCINERALAALAGIGLGELVKRCRGIKLNRLWIGASGSRATVPIGGRSLSRAVLDAALAREAIQSGAHFLPGTQARLGCVTEATRTLVVRKDGRETQLAARVVLAADGLGGTQLAAETGHCSVVDSGSRLGAGVVSSEFPEFFESGSIFMACGQGGYVGLVRLEDGRLNIAAAFDAALVKHAGGLGKAAAVILRSGGFPAISGLEALPWHGTPLLSRRVAPLAAERVFLLGDAAGYVEPFTGEGMAWALTSGIAVAPLALHAAHASARLADGGATLRSLIGQWSLIHRQTVTRRQWVCRAVANGLRHPGLVRGVVAALARFPVLATPVIRYCNRP